MENHIVKKIVNFKIVHPEVNSFRNVRYCSPNEYLDVLNEIKSNRVISSLMDDEYFPSTFEKMCKTEMNYTPDTDNSIKELIEWGSYLLESYADKINIFSTGSKKKFIIFPKSSIFKTAITIRNKNAINIIFKPDPIFLYTFKSSIFYLPR